MPFILIKRGLKSNLPLNAKLGELLYTTDENTLYIGLGETNPIKKISDLNLIPNNKDILEKFITEDERLKFNNSLVVIEEDLNAYFKKEDIDINSDGIIDFAEKLSNGTKTISIQDIDNIIENFNNMISRIANPVVGNVPIINETGQLSDSGKKLSDYSESTHNHDKLLTQTQDLNMGNKKIANLSPAILDNDAVNLKQVNDLLVDYVGETERDYNVQNLNMSGDILPTTNGLQNIGSPELRFSTIYVNEARLSTNTLYIGDTPILGTEMNTIQMTPNMDQGIMIKTTGAGQSKLVSENGAEVSTFGMNSDVKIQATGTGSSVDIGATSQINLIAPNINVTGNTHLTNGLTVDNLTVTNNIVVQGSVFSVDATTVKVSDNIIELNKDEIGNGVTVGQAGLRVNRGELIDYLMVFDEVDDMFKVGAVGSLETIASQNWVNGVMYQHPSTHPASIIVQDAGNRFVTDTEKNTWNSKAETTIATTSANGLMSSTDKTKLNGIAANANNYTHPANHAPSVITQDTNNRFVTDAEKTAWNNKAETTTATVSANGLMSSTDKTKLDGIATNANNYVHPANHPASIITEDSTHRFLTDVERTKLQGIATGAEVNQNSFSTIKIGLTDLNADTKSDTLEIIQGNGVNLTADAVNDKLTISVSMDDTLHGLRAGGNLHAIATTSIDGFISSADKTKLDGIATNANNYIHPANHTASIITQDANNRFVTDVEKTTWNAKADAASVYTKTETDARIETIVAAAPAALDTLNEIAIALNNDANFAGTMTTQLAGKLGTNDNAVSASKLAIARTISLTGDVTGSVSFDGSTNVSITAVVADDSHNHTVANVDGLQATLDEKLSTAGGTLNGGTNTTLRIQSADTGKSSIELIGSSQGTGVVYVGQSTTHGGGIFYNGDANPVFANGESADKLSLFTRTSSTDNVVFDVSHDSTVVDFKSKPTINGINVLLSNENSVSATKLATARTITLTGDATGSVSFDGSANASITVTVADDSHNHTIANVDGLQTALDSKSASTHTHVLTNLTDVTITTPASGQRLEYNGTNWVNSSLAASEIPSLDTAKITTGTFNIARIPTGTTSTTVSLGNHTHSGYLPTANMAKGASTFAGSSIAKTIAHGLGVIPSVVMITPNANPAGYLGEHWYTADATNIYVYNSGLAVTGFAWLAFK